MKTEIDKETPLIAGDVVELSFKWKFDYAWLRAAQWALIEARLKRKHDQFEVVNYTNTNTQLIVKVKVK